MTDHSEKDADQLAWTAFQYVAGELTPGEVEAFEQNLGEDHAAREAVADAVELAQATHFALRPSPKPARPASSRWWYGVPLGIAICLAVVVAAGQWPVSGTPEAVTERRDGANTEKNALAQGDLAARWSEVRQSENDPWDFAREDSSTAALIEDWPTESAMGSDHQELTASTTAPEWMLAAVSQSRTAEEMMDEMDDLQRDVDGPLDQ